MSESYVLHQSFYCPSLGKDMRYCIYLPPSYSYANTKWYSTVYLLPGLMDYEKTWCEKGRVHEHMDDLIYSGRIGEMIIVMPDKDNAALDPGMRDAFAAYLGRDLLGHIEYEYRVIRSRNHRGIEGLSLGAGWAIRMAINFPELYSSISCLSGGFGEETYELILHKQDYLRELGMRFRIGVGTAEPEAIAGNRNFANFLQKLGFYCEFAIDDGPHDWPLWVQQIYNSLQFHYYTFNS
ncbi:MAG TPA: alpha/beta hydrolase-fold protein [Candidatus Eremiobacteraeota bacterium]|nr:MAG: Endo-1,4-beta-xylanase Z precursor [bacterium ADurb.Bin363]HPZ06936.1 alpha/beta hydrolase-fold protein [Candidatus Eremiobacteraeota bacterium]